MVKYHYGDVPDTIVTKPFIPLGYDVTHKTDKISKIDSNFIISTGYGRKTKIFD
ncbi:MAG: hypothetical protein HWN66_14885 [Candidatus Helarchaeota archaeon]|nr:hypothetical protein [Candidatus Helarchaeota archaeon]